MKPWSLERQCRNRELSRITVTVFMMAILMNFLSYSFSEVNRRIDSLSDSLTESTLGFSNDIIAVSQDIDTLDTKIDDLQSDFDDIIEQIYPLETYPSTITLSDFESILADEYDRTEEEQVTLYADDAKYANFYGRFYVPDAKIDVALYYGLNQSACDRQDSAAIFKWQNYYGELIADHNTQEFSKLFVVEVGTEAYIKLKSGDIIPIVCVDVFNGHNTGDLITDENYLSVHGKADYLTYTCRSGWQNIRICLWDVI